jgi:hypothetical protein
MTTKKKTKQEGDEAQKLRDLAKADKQKPHSPAPKKPPERYRDPDLDMT